MLTHIKSSVNLDKRSFELIHLNHIFALVRSPLSIAEDLADFCVYIPRRLGQTQVPRMMQ